MRVDGVEVNALVDSGAEVNLVGSDLLEKGTELKKIDINIRSLTGQVVDLNGCMEVELTMIDGRKFTCYAAVVNKSKMMILGMPFLRDNRAQLDLGANVI